MPLNRVEVLGGLVPQLREALTRQMASADHPDTGAVIRADWGIGEPGATAGLVALALWTHLLASSHPDLEASEAKLDQEELGVAHRALLALDYLERVQRPSGLTDLRDCNYDSSPDAGFILQAICPPLLLAKNLPRLSGEWEDIRARLNEVARKMTEGARTGGFHTPNHRWVLSGALYLAGRLFPEIPTAPTIEAYLSEGIDLDSDGFYIERSAGVYDAICARSLFLLKRESVSQLACRNLRADSFLLNADGTIKTGLSHRQDQGITPTFAANLAVPFLLAHFSGGCESDEAARFADIAHWLWNLTPADRRDYYAMSQVLLAHGEPPPASSSPLPDCAHHFPLNGLWRWRKGALSVSVFRDQVRLLNFRAGSAFLASLSIHQSYFGVGQFVADELHVTWDDNRFADKGTPEVRLISTGQRNPRRPGYDQPLGRPVDPADWGRMRAERELRKLPPPACELSIAVVDGLRLCCRTTDGMDGVCAQIALDFSSGGVWETEDTSFEPQGGQVIFLKSGYGTMRYPGGDQIRVGPGANAHRMANMRDSAPPAAGHLVRVLIALETPLCHEFTITAGRS